MPNAHNRAGDTTTLGTPDWRVDALSAASFWLPEYHADSTWLEHAPFAFWLTGALRPSSVVELGTHRAFSYFALCQAVLGHDLECRCFAVDHWRGDEHAGFYGNDVYESVAAHSSTRYSAISTLLRMDFASAAERFDAGTVDLLHIDGRHRYEDVAEDFEKWKDKLSSRSIVLFHDTAIRDRGFGVYKFWGEVSSEHPAFEFEHGSGLGVLGFGSTLPSEVSRFFSTAGVDINAAAIRQAYSRLGETVRLRYMIEHSGLAKELQTIRSSRSWRWTAPLRGLSTRLRLS